MFLFHFTTYRFSIHAEEICHDLQRKNSEFKAFLSLYTENRFDRTIFYVLIRKFSMIMQKWSESLILMKVCSIDSTVTHYKLGGRLGNADRSTRCAKWTRLIEISFQIFLFIQFFFLQKYWQKFGKLCSQQLCLDVCATGLFEIYI